jgi:hypothetical protein
VPENGNKLSRLDIKRNVIDRTDRTGRISLFIPLYIIMDQFADFNHVYSISLDLLPGSASAASGFFAAKKAKNRWREMYAPFKGACTITTRIFRASAV